LESIAVGDGIDLVVWQRSPDVSPGVQGIYARLIDAQSARPVSAQVRVANPGSIGSIVTAYNQHSGDFLLLWQPLPIGGKPQEIAGQLVDRRLRPVGRQLQIASHDFYLYEGNLAADADTGAFLVAQLEASHEPVTRRKLFVTAVGSSGVVTAARSWPVQTADQPGASGEAQVMDQPGAQTYRVSWSWHTNIGTIFTSRAVSGDLRQLSQPTALADAPGAYGADFAIARAAGSHKLLAVWLQRAANGHPAIAVQPLTSDARPIGHAAIAAAIAEPGSAPGASLSRLHLARSGDHDVAWWQGVTRTQAVQFDTSGSSRGQVVIDMTGSINNYSHATAANPTADTVTIISRSDTDGAPSQVYARSVRLPR
jgi:hypothetical protein